MLFLLDNIPQMITNSTTGIISTKNELYFWFFNYNIFYNNNPKWLIYQTIPSDTHYNKYSIHPKWMDNTAEISWKPEQPIKSIVKEFLLVRQKNIKTKEQ